MAQKSKVTAKSASKGAPAARKSAPKATSAKLATRHQSRHAAPSKSHPKSSSTTKVKSHVPSKSASKKVAQSKPAAKAAPKAAVKPPKKPVVAAKAAAPAAKSAAPKAVVAKAPVKAPVAKPHAAAVKHAVAKPAAVRPADAAHPAVAKAVEAVKPAAAAVRAMPAAVAKPAGQRITAAVEPATPKDIAEKAAAARQLIAAQKKPVSQRHGFKTNEFIVYPAHGVGRIVGIEEQEIAGMSLELFVITFDKEKLTLSVPTGKLESVGMRKLADDAVVKKSMEILKGRARIKRTMWSRRAQEYVAKINSGDLVSIAEVVRDLYRSEAQPEQSYSERQLYEDALDRMAREIAAVEKLDERGAVQRITDVLSKSARGRRAEETGEDMDAEVKAA